MKRLPLPACATLVGLLSGCGDSTGPGPATVSVSDPAGDTYGARPVQWDLVALTISRDAGGITVELAFTDTVISPMSGDSTAMIGFVDFDTDQRSATGQPSVVDLFRPGGDSTGMGVDYRLHLEEFLGDSTVLVRDADNNATGQVRPRFDGTRVTIRIPKALLGNDDGVLYAAAIVGTRAEPTDIIPENGRLTLGR